MTRPAVAAALVFVLAACDAASGSDSAAPAGLIVSDVSAPVKNYRRTRTWLEISTLDGRNRRRLTPRPARGRRRLDTDPAISPEGKAVAFARLTPSGSSLWIVGVDGTAPRMIVPPARIRALFGRRTQLAQLVWSRDGRNVMAVVDARIAGCKSLGVITTAVESPLVRVVVRLKPRVSATLAAGDWSPDGKSVAYVTKYNDGECISTHEGANIVSVASIDGSRHRGLLRTGVTEGVSWSPDGRQLAYAGHCETICNLFVVDPDGSHRRRLTAFTDPTMQSAYGLFPFTWWNGKLLYALGRALFTLDSHGGRPSKLVALAHDGSLSASSSTAAVTDDGRVLEAVSLPDGAITPLPYPQALRRSDSLDYFVVGLGAGS